MKLCLPAIVFREACKCTKYTIHFLSLCLTSGKGVRGINVAITQNTMQNHNLKLPKRDVLFVADFDMSVCILYLFKKHTQDGSRKGYFSLEVVQWIIRRLPSLVSGQRRGFVLVRKGLEYAQVQMFTLANIDL